MFQESKKEVTKPRPFQMPPKPCPHSLAGQGAQHGGPEADKLSQHHYHHTQGPAEMSSHVSPTPNDRIPKQLLYKELCQGKRTIGGL